MPRNRTKEFFHRIHSKSEDLLFNIIQRLPERLIPPFLMNWLDQYTTKRVEELKRQIIHDNWNKTYLNQAASEIQTRQQDTNKAPDKD